MTRPATAWKITLHFDADLGAIGIVRKLAAHIARIAGAPPGAADDVEVAVGEVLTNTYRHAYGGQAGPLELEVSRGDAGLEILVHDDGKPIADKPFIPATLPAGPGGRGLYVIGP